MTWIEVIIETEFSDTEPVSDALIHNGALSVSIEDVELGTDSEEPLFGEPGTEPKVTAWQRSRVVALIEFDADHIAMVSSVAHICNLPIPDYSTRLVADQNWVELMHSKFHPIYVGKDICIVPSWHSMVNDASLIIELDPGLAFGTGNHPTTRLCIEWLEIHIPSKKPKSLLDYGCGSGILAIVSKKIGSTEISIAGIDIDPEAINVAHYNSKRNHCDINYFLEKNFNKNKILKNFDVVIANILSEPLKNIAQKILSYLNETNGNLVLSGILEEQATDVITYYRPWISLDICAIQEGWVLLSGVLR